ncbi:ethanolamine ammonia-lyase subunit EutC [Aureimonas sp. AU40]|uniref:ethanolamine ammonia-lyase subunit EutC n=1 Tax=Aureimonas sp. AU40 TaxID=1637747 RepID=UPI0009EB37D9|nr:ethanolamine ammonia-lyase subunit EutC [Aureimonas sp. AU40]
MSGRDGDAPKPLPTQDTRPRSLRDLAGLTQARIALGAHGSGVPTGAALRFNLDHARAREAVWTAMDAGALAAAMAAQGLASLEVWSNAANRADYLRRPDLGRTLSSGSADALRAARGEAPGFDLAIVVADGLSATAVALNAAPLAGALAERAARLGWRLAPVVIAHQGRVALGDPVGAMLGARCVALLVGERPGLSAADSLGCYLTFAPEPGLPDSRRNCLSNIREGGLGIDAAADQIMALLALMRAQTTSGVALRRTDEAAAIERRGGELA